MHIHACNGAYQMSNSKCSQYCETGSFWSPTRRWCIKDILKV